MTKRHAEPAEIEVTSSQVEWFTDMADQHPDMPVGDHEHYVTPDGTTMVSLYRGATSVEALNAYVADLPDRVKEGWTVLATVMTFNAIRYVGILAVGSSPQFVVQPAFVVTWTKAAKV